MCLLYVFQHTCAKELIVSNEDMNGKLTTELHSTNEKYSRTSEELRVSVDRCSTAEEKHEDLSEKYSSLVQKSSLLEEENSFIPGLNEEVQKLRKSFAKSEDERTRALEKINVLERQNNEMYSSSVEIIALLKKRERLYDRGGKGQD